MLTTVRNLYCGMPIAGLAGVFKVDKPWIYVLLWSIDGFVQGSGWSVLTFPTPTGIQIKRGP